MLHSNKFGGNDSYGYPDHGHGGGGRPEPRGAFGADRHRQPPPRAGPGGDRGNGDQGGEYRRNGEHGDGCRGGGDRGGGDRGGGDRDGGDRGGGDRGGEDRGGRSRRNRRGDISGVSLLVRNVAHDITTQDLEQAFGRIGTVRDVYIPRDFHSQQPKGFAFVEYGSHDQANEALVEMNTFVIKGKELEVVFAQEKRKTPTQMRDRVVDGDDEDEPPRDSHGGGGGNGSMDNGNCNR